MAKEVKETPEVVENVETTKEAPVKEKTPESVEVVTEQPKVTFEGDARVDYLDIDNPKHGNKTYNELQK